LTGETVELMVTVRNLAARTRSVRVRILLSQTEETFVDTFDLNMELVSKEIRESAVTLSPLPASGPTVVTVLPGPRAFDDYAQMALDAFNSLVKATEVVSLGTFRVFDREPFLEERTRFRVIAILSSVAAVAAVSTAVLIILHA
jgi:hypothetical protein